MYPRNMWGLLGLHQCLERAGKGSDPEVGGACPSVFLTPNNDAGFGPIGFPAKPCFASDGSHYRARSWWPVMAAMRTKVMPGQSATSP